MSVKLTGELNAGFSTRLIHESGAIIETTAPKDNGGSGTLFSPTDLFAVSLGSCGLTVMSLYAEQKKIPLEHAEFVMEKEMHTNSPRRVKQISIVYKIKTSANEEDFKRLESIAKTCPVRASLHPEIILIEKFERI